MKLFLRLSAVSVAISLSLTGLRVAAANDGETFTVTNANDSGAGSLRQALLDSEANDNTPLQDVVAFSIPGNGPHTINVASALPVIREPVIIDGYTQGDSTLGPDSDDARPNDALKGSNAILKIVVKDAGAITFGIDIQSPNVAVRGLVIQSFAFGIRIDSPDVTIQGNFIGTAADGTSAAGNESAGVGIVANDALIGGPELADRNVISGNVGQGISFGSGQRAVVIENNLIGVGANFSDLGNGADGIFVRSLGGDAPDRNVISGNVIANNSGRGIAVFLDGNGTKIERNSIAFNGSIGIDLQGFSEPPGSVTPNDKKDKDEGANGLQNFPVLGSAEDLVDGTQIEGVLDSVPNTKFIIEFFASPAVDGTNHGEGDTFIGSIKVKTNSKGKAKFNVLVDEAPAGQAFITATATHKKLGNTSEFSEAEVLI